MRKTKAPVTYTKLKGLMSYLTALIKEKRRGVAASSQTFGGDTDVDQHRTDGGGGLAARRSDESAAAAHLSFTASPQILHKVSAADFRYLKVIGAGSFGKVLLAEHRKSRRYFAVKVLQKNRILERDAEELMCERSVLLKTPTHPFLVKLHCSFQTRERLYLVLDYASGGELFYHLQREHVFSESRGRFYAAELACALGYLHSHHIIYRDLKPENILLDAAGHVVLTDFGLCKEDVVGISTTKTFCGTPEYLPPEVLQLQEYDRTVDWWALGVVLHEMLYGLPPFYSAERMKMLRNIIHQPLVLKAGVSKTARDLLKRLLNKDRAKRLGAKHDVLELRRHGFFSALCWDELETRRIPPPFIPPHSGPDDITNVDPAFTKLPVPESLCVCEESAGSFRGFSYTSDVELSSTSIQIASH